MGTYITSGGQSITTGTLLGKGGEGGVYLVPSAPYRVAKIYLAKPQGGDKENKLKIMIRNPPTDETRQKLRHISIVWPEDILYEKGSFAGFLMPKIDQHPIIYDCYVPQIRKTKFPGLNLAHLHRIAGNLAAAIHAIHTAGYVVGDINQKNIFVTPQSMITVIDTDSFQVRDTNGRIYRCLVGVPEFMAPELLVPNVKLINIDRTRHQDNFSLAILIYKLLLDGRHPYKTGESIHQD